jgi:ferritin-like metal-binding protein YciE
MHLADLKDLFVDELNDIYNAEQQILTALPKAADAAVAPELIEAIREHEAQTRGHVQRLERIFKRLGESPHGKTCKGVQGLIAEAQELIHEQVEPEVLDAGLIGALQKVEHYEIAAYGTVRSHALVLGEEDTAGLLQQTLDEESETDEKLTDLAEDLINQAAAEAETDFDEGEE